MGDVITVCGNNNRIRGSAIVSGNGNRVNDQDIDSTSWPEMESADELEMNVETMEWIPPEQTLPDNAHSLDWMWRHFLGSPRPDDEPKPPKTPPPKPPDVLPHADVTTSVEALQCTICLTNKKRLCLCRAATNARAKRAG